MRSYHYSNMVYRTATQNTRRRWNGAQDYTYWEQMERGPLESCFEEARSNGLTEELGKLADGKGVELPVKEMANNVAAGETEKEERSVGLTADRYFLAESRFVHCRGKVVLNNVAAGDIGNLMRIAAADYHGEELVSMVAAG
jgi:hypothetical protein